MPAPPKLTPAQIRERRSKRLALGLGVVFLAVAAIQGPKLVKLLHGSSSAAPVVTSSTTTSATTTATVAGVADVSSGHRNASFASYPLKDPFRAQVAGAVSATGSSTDTAAASGAGATATTSQAPVVKRQVPAKKATTTTAATTTAAVTTTTGPGVVFVAPTLPPNAAVLVFDGNRQTVLVGAGFPAGDPLFKLISLGKKTIKIGVLGGSFTDGSPALTLKLRKPLTLANEADGTHYILRLIGLTTATALPAETASGTAPTPTTTGTTTATG